MRKVLTTVMVTGALLTGGFAVTTTSAAAAVAKCDGVTTVKVGGNGDYVRQPVHKATKSRNCALSAGASGAEVIALQTSLKSCNYASNLAIDGDYGPATKKAVAYAQFKRGIGQDGIYGSESRRAFAWSLYFAAGNPSGKCVFAN